MKFGRLIEFNIRNNSLEESCTKCCGETLIERAFYETSRTFYSVFFIVCPSQGLPTDWD